MNLNELPIEELDKRIANTRKRIRQLMKLNAPAEILYNERQLLRKWREIKSAKLN